MLPMERPTGMKIRIIFRPVGDPALEGNRLLFVDVTDEDGTPLGSIQPNALEWLADGDHEALQIDTDMLPPQHTLPRPVTN